MADLHDGEYRTAKGCVVNVVPRGRPARGDVTDKLLRGAAHGLHPRPQVGAVGRVGDGCDGAVRVDGADVECRPGEARKPAGYQTSHVEQSGFTRTC